MASPTSSYEKTRPVEAGEIIVYQSWAWWEAVNLMVPLWQHTGRQGLWWAVDLACVEKLKKVTVLQVSLAEAEVQVSPGCLGWWKGAIGKA